MEATRPHSRPAVPRCCCTCRRTASAPCQRALAARLRLLQRTPAALASRSPRRVLNGRPTCGWLGVRGRRRGGGCQRPCRPAGACTARHRNPPVTQRPLTPAPSQTPHKSLIHAWPSLELLATLSGGAERGYSALAFDPAGGTLASVACAPDYTLTLWDWRRGGLLLRARAFGADVHRVAFSLRDPGRLVTAGAGHIRFWRMAATFTGRKLQVCAWGGGRCGRVPATTRLPPLWRLLLRARTPVRGLRSTCQRRRQAPRFRLMMLSRALPMDRTTLPQRPLKPTAPRHACRARLASLARWS